jgi:DNA invertase Pin-like site-specific DNA recombinase
MSMTTRWIGYVRCSTREQKMSGLGLGDQENSIRLAIAATGDELVEVISDTGTAKNVHRPGLQRAFAMLAAGEADGIVVAKLDRISRSVVDFAKLLEWFRSIGASGAAFRSLDLGIDTSTAAGEMVAGMMMCLAQWEARVIGERTTAALGELKRQGGAVSGPRADADVRKLIKSMRDRDGMTLQAIADQLNEDGIPTARGGKRWERATVRSVLNADAGVKRVNRPKAFIAPKVAARRR